MKENKMPMIFIWGLFLLSLGIIFDDVTSYILFGMGLKILETNPLYQSFGLIVMIIGMWILYLFIGITWNYITRMYHKFYEKKYIMYKLYDVFVFLFCILIAYICISKIMIGMSNINIMHEYSTYEGKLKWDNYIKEVELLKETNEQQYQTEMKQYYDTSRSISYGEFLFIALTAYMLFRVGYRVTPWDLGR